MSIKEIAMVKNQGGMTLMESLISLVILSFGLIATTKMQINLTTTTQISRQRVEAVALAKSKIEFFRSTGVCSAAESGTYTPLQGNTTYTITVTCSDSKNPKLVVGWNDSKGDQEKVAGGFDNRVELNTTLQ
jgi:prepilin-type N-terminal cleavage/methylation domain-containing protein